MGASAMSTPAGYDVVIVGGGPAGCAAAIAARRQRLAVLLVEPRAPVASPGCAGWLGPAAVRLCGECGVDAQSAGAATFTGLRLWTWDLATKVAIDDPELTGWVVSAPALGQALLAAARVAGAEVRTAAVVHVQLGETNATLRLSDGEQVSGQVVLIAAGAASPTARLANLAGAPPDGSAGRAARVCGRLATDGVGLDVIIGAGRALRVATVARRGREVCLTLVTHESASPAEAQLAALLATVRAAGAWPIAEADVPEAVPCLAGAALELDSHVGKRCLLVGDAGGFSAAFSNEGIYPALRSGWLAAEAVARAVRAPVLQDELGSFSAAWRADLADYLRMPNTDLGLLLPMVFNNAQMSRRVGRAFLLGQAF